MKSILKKNFKILFIVAFFLVICNIGDLLHPLVMKNILDIDLHSNDIQNILIRLFLIYVGIHIILAFCRNVRNTIINKAMTKILKELREKLFCHVLKWDMSTYQKYNSSEIYTRLTADIENVSSLFLGTLQIILNNCLYIGMLVIFMFWTDMTLAILGTIAIFLIAITSYIFTHQIAKCNKKILEKRDKENRQYSEMYNKNKLTYLFSLQKQTKMSIWKTLDEECKFRERFIFVEHFLYPLTITIQALAVYVILKYALNINISISLGSIYLVINYIQRSREPLIEIFTQLEEIQASIISLKKINKLLKEPT